MKYARVLPDVVFARGNIAPPCVCWYEKRLASVQLFDANKFARDFRDDRFIVTAWLFVHSNTVTLELI